MVTQCLGPAAACDRQDSYSEWAADGLVRDGTDRTDLPGPRPQGAGFLFPTGIRPTSPLSDAHRPGRGRGTEEVCSRRGGGSYKVTCFSGRGEHAERPWRLPSHAPVPRPASGAAGRLGTFSQAPTRAPGMFPGFRHVQGRFVLISNVARVGLSCRKRHARSVRKSRGRNRATRSHLSPPHPGALCPSASLFCAHVYLSRGSVTAPSLAAHS